MQEVHSHFFAEGLFSAPCKGAGSCSEEKKKRGREPVCVKVAALVSTLLQTLNSSFFTLEHSCY